MRFQTIVMVAATQGGGAAVAVPELNPDPNFALGTTGWATTDSGTCTVNTGSIDFTDADNSGSRLSPKSTTGTDFVAALANSTAYVVRVTVANYVSGTIFCVLKSGTAVDMQVTGNGIFTKTVTSGISAVTTNTRLQGNAAGTATMRVTQWSVKAS